MKPNKRGLGHVYKLQQQTREKKQSKSVASLATDDIALMTELIGLSNCCVDGRANGCLTNFFVQNDGVFDMHMLVKALELLR